MQQVGLRCPALLDGARPLVRGSGRGPLLGLRVAVKDVLDVAGTVTGCGNPDLAAARLPAMRSAAPVSQLLAAGADVTAKAVTDELAWSLQGTNAHVGTPANPTWPDRLPGGSSSGPASAVAGGLVDVGLGTDTAGSIRVPAAYCGLVGFRPTHGVVSTEGMTPLAPSFDTVGWLTRDSDTAYLVGTTLLPAVTARPVATALLATDLLTAADPEVAQQLRTAALTLPVAVSTGDTRIDLAAAARCLRILQGAQAWQQHGVVISALRLRTGPGVAGRLTAAALITSGEVESAQRGQALVADQLLMLLEQHDLLILPSAPTLPPMWSPLGTCGAAARERLLGLTCLASLAGFPALALPSDLLVGRRDASPAAGLCLLAAPGRDRDLLEWARGLVRPTS